MMEMDLMWDVLDAMDLDLEKKRENALIFILVNSYL